MIIERFVSTRRGQLAVMVTVLLVAAGLRFVGLDNVTPPGLEHDEVAHWLINRDILAGNHAVYFTEAYGHEALYHYLQAGFGALVGDHALGLRLPSAYLGVLLVAVGYVLGRRLFGVGAGLFAAAFLAVLFWPVFYSRLALRAIALPVFSGLSAYFWWVAMRPRLAPAIAFKWYALAGLFAGLALHTYMAARAVPIFYALFVLYLVIFHRETRRVQWRGIALFGLVLVVVALPLAGYLLTNPGAEVRIAEVDAPLRALRGGDWRPVLENAGRIALMFGVRGDPLWRQNIAGRPVFDPVLALLFYGGVLLSLWRLREPRHAFIVLWLAASVLPSLVTVDAPSSIRMINLLPVLMLFPALFIHKVVGLSTARGKLSTKLTTRVTVGVLTLIWLFQTASTINGLWRVWPANSEVRFVWQAALTAAAAHLDADEEGGPVAVGGWTPDTMDPPTMELTLRRQNLALRYFNPAESLLLPAVSPGRTARLVWPAILPLAPSLEGIVGERQLLPENAEVDRQFALAEYAVQPVPSPDVSADVTFSEELRFLGYDPATACAVTSRPCTLTTYWQVLEPPQGPRRIFAHVVNESGEIVAQDDRLGAPAEHWREGDLVVQVLNLPNVNGEIRLGVYDPQTGERLRTGDGHDFVVLRAGNP